MLTQLYYKLVVSYGKACVMAEKKKEGGTQAH